MADIQKNLQHQKEAEQIKKKEFDRRLWDSRHLFFEGAGIRKQLAV